MFEQDKYIIQRREVYVRFKCDVKDRIRAKSKIFRCNNPDLGPETRHTSGSGDDKKALGVRA